jgi:hypothetical protein
MGPLLPATPGIVTVNGSRIAIDNSAASTALKILCSLVISGSFAEVITSAGSVRPRALQRRLRR